ncbi:MULTISPECIES: PTS sugar transporter subunit IIB [Clostridium]|jgi:PTS system cellobiose-specific IIB component|uniref:Phosphotransferase system cellobiose-specific component IIB n=1 Tax=Clostridium saccharoperbutylacetonicum N1-4(HMT) TaxID=931276 RepID=M1N6T9_9CLOT|nr:MULTISPECIES: PTS sugar transporter subunit IIB [Clostridium]AGF59112.1 phosphotransferase system cellobiose-specific component IIB [Clostridium saccharoperbutylacetonicum N1-4(HMT)]NRT60100.1 PTS system cellobiose-specific IIB component [Clostridium saccharoperbutylacetonicum]NSB23412.1 PTS system cellobiose-specific IIB component [Clostridium saccharoperbutylacetonicum]NSB42782.1 PTS system cellobiose-specific IIB component [Clostridium saccharoperbutylacetonicum]
MVTIKLFCASGMSTSVLVNKMKEAAKAKGVEAEIVAFPESQMDKHLDSMDVALLGPQVGYTLGKAKSLCDPKGIPVEVIPMVDYGMMNGTKVLDLALKLANK